MISGERGMVRKGMEWTCRLGSSCGHVFGFAAAGDGNGLDVADDGICMLRCAICCAAVGVIASRGSVPPFTIWKWKRALPLRADAAPPGGESVPMPGDDVRMGGEMERSGATTDVLVLVAVSVVALNTANADADADVMISLIGRCTCGLGCVGTMMSEREVRASGEVDDVGGRATNGFFSVSPSPSSSSSS